MRIDSFVNVEAGNADVVGAERSDRLAWLAEEAQKRTRKSQ